MKQNQNETINLGIQLAKVISEQKAKQYGLDVDTLHSFLLEKFCSNILPKLTKAIDEPKYKPKAFIIKSFNGYVLNFIRDYSRPIKISRKYKDLYMLERAMLKRLPDASDAQIALECGTNLDELQIMRKYMNTKFISFDAMLTEPVTQSAESAMSSAESSVYSALCKLDDEEFAEAYAYFVDGDETYANSAINNNLIHLKNQNYI